ncbi:MAG: CPBP family intramembrane glutamic endopeptidase [Thermodesulfobacteriota bacterium]
MEPKAVRIDALGLAVAGVLVVEAALGLARVYRPLPPLALLGLARLLELGLLAAVVHAQAGGLGAVGLARKDLAPGLRAGLAWSAAFALVAAAGLTFLHLADFPFRNWLDRLPGGVDLVLFYVVGGIVSPAAEEFFFRGLIYTFFRRWGVAAALLVSTAAFVASHWPRVSIPVTQIVGGVVFALAYERHGRLLAPVTIHVLGNLALFSLAWFLQPT